MAAAPALSGQRARDVVLVVMQHGSHGHACDFGNLRARLEKSWTQTIGDRVPLEFWTTPVNEGLATDDGLERCGDRLATALGAGFREVAARHPEASQRVVCIGHSFGGPLLRYALMKLHGSGELGNKTLITFVTLASPHVGARQLHPFLRLGARFLGKVFSSAYQDLLLDSGALDELCTEEALAPLARFHNRRLYAVARGDMLVRFETGSLVVPAGYLKVECLPPAVEGHPHVRRALLLEPFGGPWEQAEGSEAPPIRVLMMLSSDGGLVTSRFEEVTQPVRCQQVFSGFDDWSGKSQRAAHMLQTMRSVGKWTLHIVDFPERMVNRHGAIICHPTRAKNPSRHGDDVVQHLSGELCRDICDSLRLHD